MLTISLFVLFSLLLNTISQIIPLRFDLAIDRLQEYQQISLNNLLKHVEFNLTPEQMLEYMSLLLSNNETNSCQQDFQLILQAAIEKQTWALKTLDAWGKPLPSGILKGNVYWLGNYNECIYPMYDPANKSFMSQPLTTQHCTLLPTSSKSNSRISLILGLCVPSSCDRQSLVSLIELFFKQLNITEDNFVCSNDPPNGQRHLSNGVILTIIVLSVLCLLVLIGTMIDLIPKSKMTSIHNFIIHNGTYDDLVNENEIRTESKSNRTSRILFLSEFSALKSLRRIFTVKETNNNDSYVFLNGIRVLSLFWVIIAHSLLYSLSYTNNITDILTSTRNILFQLISDAQFSVDTFFVLSGFLTTILFLRQVKKDEKLSFRLIFLYYIHRYIRLTPVFLLMILISINLTPYFGQGPMYPIEQGFESKGCREGSWWTSIFYLSNFIKSDDMCLNIGWYLNNDMQFHWIAPLTLIPFVLRRKTLAISIAISFVFIGIGSILSILLYYPNVSLNNPATLTNNFGGPSFYTYVYIKPWCRISAYAIGLLTGYIVTITGRQYRMNRYIQIIGNILIIPLALICLFGTYPDNIYVNSLSRSVIVAYISLSRTFWSMVIGWLLFLCSTNQGGIVNDILSWSIWTPFARLNYSCYLVHSTILHILIYNQTMPFYYQGYLLLNNFISHTFLCYFAAIFVSIFFETPFFIIEKKLFKR
ncbi:hypothetical protein I4U23_015870 [Adineta vaga]|nr:hypothetical protein I4U23_015870 [Adineta vaga]